MKGFKEVATGSLKNAGLESEVGFRLLRVAESRDGGVMTLALNEEDDTYTVTIESDDYAQKAGLALEAANQLFDSRLG